MFRIFSDWEIFHTSMSIDPIFHSSILILPVLCGLIWVFNRLAQRIWTHLIFNSVKFTFLDHSEKWRGPGASLEALASVPWNFAPAVQIWEPQKSSGLGCSICRLFPRILSFEKIWVTAEIFKTWAKNWLRWKTVAVTLFDFGRGLSRKKFRGWSWTRGWARVRVLVSVSKATTPHVRGKCVRWWVPVFTDSVTPKNVRALFWIFQLLSSGTGKPA